MPTLPFANFGGVVSCQTQGNHAVIREEFADDFYTSSLSTTELVVFPAIKVGRFASGNDLEAGTDRRFGGDSLDVFETWSFLQAAAA